MYFTKEKLGIILIKNHVVKKEKINNMRLPNRQVELIFHADFN